MNKETRIAKQNVTVEIQNVTKTFSKHIAVDDLSLTVPQGSIYGFIGPNGSGKTTTLRMIMGIIYPDSGAIRVFGEDVYGSRSDRIGYLPEERGLYKNMKVREILQFYGELKSGRNVTKEVDRWLERFDLNDWANKKVETLSKGMSQKVQFIATVVSQPEMLILDEPFTGLDPVNVDVIKSAVLDLQARGTTIILSTHDMNVAETMCDFIFMIFKGRKVLDGTLGSIQEAYGHDTLRIRSEDGLSALQNLPGVDSINNFGQMQELHLTQDCDPQEVLATIMARTRVKSFEIASPSLHDIFVRIAAPKGNADAKAV
ncbi:ATP-binding cassette domain-containing protein [Candidatus Poribacteria bacterium]|nr:ATP-binding cassette domain-containing protein [Candidatus Poribacteria bacterium]